jgi:FkbM family methyltransferase
MAVPGAAAGNDNMKTASWLRETAGKWIAGNRRGRVVARLHRFATWVESCYHNENTDLATNGEYGLLRKLQGENFRTVVDAGANVGDWTLMAVRNWPSCHVHAFEIVPQTFAKLQESVAGAPDRNITPVNCGLGDETGTIQIYFYPEYPDLSCDRPRHGSHAIAISAPVTTLAEYCAQARIETIDFLKIDVEGAEPAVLRGAGELVAAGRIDCIQFEYGAFSIDTRFLLRDYYEMLGQQYWIGKIHPGYVDFREYDWRMEDFRFCNYLCVSRRRPDLKEKLG